MRKPSQRSRSEPVPPIAITREVVRRVLATIGACPPETGGILLGPVGSDEITEYYFDVTARCTHGTYTPDVDTLRRKFEEEWVPYGLHLRGFCHSHPGTFDRLSSGDLTYIARLLKANPDMPAFAAPIVIPGQFRLRPIVVLRTEPTVPRPTVLKII